MFHYVADARNRPRWDQSVDSEEMTSPEPIGVGTTVRTKLRAMGRNDEYTWVVVEHVPCEHMTINSTSGPMDITMTFRVEDAGHEGTRVRFAFTCRPTGFLRVAQPVVARVVQRNLDRAFPRLKLLLETGSVPA